MIDIEHYIELKDINSSDSVKIAGQIKHIMQQRRDIRQQIQLINRLHECNSIEHMIDGHFELPSETVTKKYNPRSEKGKTLFAE